MSNIKQRIRFLEADAKHHDVKSSSIMMVSTRTALSIIEEFRELEQRAEAAEAQLAELAKQKPVGTVSIVRDWNTHRNVATVNMRHDLVVSEMKDGDELYTRAAPDAVPVDLVPPMKDDSIPGKNDSYIDMCDGWNACRAEMLRRIEELK